MPAGPGKKRVDLLRMERALGKYKSPGVWKQLHFRRRTAGVPAVQALGVRPVESQNAQSLFLRHQKANNPGRATAHCYPQNLYRSLSTQVQLLEYQSVNSARILCS